jgi:hypothetical protein
MGACFSDFRGDLGNLGSLIRSDITAVAAVLAALIGGDHPLMESS